MSRRCVGIAWVALVFAMTAGARGAVVTYTLSLNDDGFGNGGGTSTPGAFAIYADVSQGDNFGLFAFGVDLVDGPIDFIANMAAQGRFSKAGSPTKFVGFSAGVTEDAPTGKISGLPDLAKGVNLIPAYGFGQTGGDLNALKPATYGNYVDTNPNAPGSAYNAHFLLGIGSYHGPASGMGWQAGSVDNKASVYTANGGSTSSAVAQLVLRNGCAIFSPLVGASKGLAATCEPPPATFSVSGFAEHANQAVGGNIFVFGHNNMYSSEVDQLLDPSVNSGSAPIQTIGDEAGNLYVMAKVIGSAADVAAVLADLNNTTGDPQAALLHAAYDSQFGPGGFNLLYKTPNFSGAKVVNWDFAFTTGAVIDQMAVVPEPGAFGLVGLGMILLGRRRR
jgi:MYXO-CTERM domain-containing protein